MNNQSEAFCWTEEKHPYWNRNSKDGDIVWVIEWWEFPDDWTQEKHDTGEYDPVGDSIEKVQFHPSVVKAKSAAAKIAKNRKGKLQWWPWYRRAIYDADLSTWFWDEDCEVICLGITWRIQ
jgi:hypothetical protein